MNDILEEHEGVSLRQACRIINISTSVQRYVPKLRADDDLYSTKVEASLAQAYQATFASTFGAEPHLEHGIHARQLVLWLCLQVVQPDG